MRRISRPIEPPSLLMSEQVLEEKKKILDYLRRDRRDRLQRRDGLNDDIFFNHEFRRDLWHVFSGKCAFCESKADEDGQVLHLRPLRFAGGGANSDKDYYLWLAFEWRNIFYACSFCLKSKGSKFPVSGNRAIYLASFDDVVQQEQSLLLDPATDDPAKHLRFLYDGNILPATERGEETAEVFQLNREDLVYDRQGLVRRVFEFLKSDDPNYALISLESLLFNDAAHAGFLQGILKRVDSAWRVAEPPIKGNGEAFVRRFLDVWREADQGRRSQIQTVEKQIQDADHQAQFATQDQFAGSVFERTPSLAISGYQAIDREISRIEVSNFKAIERLELYLRSIRSERSGTPSLMILGENSTGKSSLLSAIALALIGRREASKLRRFLPSLVRSSATDRFDQLDAPRVAVDVNFHFLSHTASFIYDPIRRLVDGTDDQSTIVLGYGPRRYFSPKKRHHATGAAARIRTLFDPLATIPYPADWLRAQTGGRFDTIASALRIVLALDDDDELIVEPDYLAVRANGRTTPIDSLSEGYRSVFVMTVDIIRELLNHWQNLEQAQAVVLIDEIETHLHPRWKMQVMTSLRRVLPRVQFIATTHDPLCLRGMDDGEVVVLQRDSESAIQQLQDLPSVSGMSAEQLLTSDYFGLASTADPSTEIEFARLAGDVARRNRDGVLELAPAMETMELVNRLTVGDSPTEQIIQEALVRYLAERESRKGDSRPALRAEAVEAVIKALRSSEG
ncbi:DUF2813 domain-containing protein [Burkholderia vietnamiensis]|nr:DUF2813 domain-containing protein [Burkholderia vietnamiensis]